MAREIEDPFYELVNRLIMDAESIDCSFAVFVEGLNTILDEIRERHNMAIAGQVGFNEGP